MKATRNDVTGYGVKSESHKGTNSYYISPAAHKAMSHSAAIKAMEFKAFRKKRDAKSRPNNDE